MKLPFNPRAYERDPISNLLEYNDSFSPSPSSTHIPSPRRYPLYRNITLTSLILDGATSKLSVWVDANPSSPDAAASFVWDLATFFDGAPVSAP